MYFPAWVQNGFISKWSQHDMIIIIYLLVIVKVLLFKFSKMYYTIQYIISVVLY